MPLRLRLILLTALVLLVCLACGSVLVGWHAAGSVRTELRAALDVGANAIRNGLDEAARADDPARELRRLVATFNGNRHVRAILLDARDQPVAASELVRAGAPAPDWFRTLIGRQPDAVRIAVRPVRDGGNAIVLQADPTNEIGEVWGESRDAVLVLGGFRAAERPADLRGRRPGAAAARDLSTAFARIGKGEYHAQGAGAWPARTDAPGERLQ